LKNIIKYILFYCLILFTIIFQSCNTIGEKTQQKHKTTDSISNWIKSSRKKNNSLSQKKQYLLKAYTELKTRENNKLKTKNLSVIAYRYYELKDTLLFQKINQETQKLAYQLKDSFSIADTHWSLADYYNHRNLFNKSYYHYNKAYEYFNGINKTYETARMLYAMAYIKGNYNDYYGSEILTFNAIEKFKKLKNYKYLYTAYNHLALLQNDVKRHKRAIFYHEKAKGYISKIKGSKKKYYSTISNNIGNDYKYIKDYTKAIDYFYKSLKNTDKISDSVMIISNIAHTRFLMLDTIRVKKDLLWSLKIRDSLKIRPGIMSSNIRLSDYYKFIKDTINAIKHAINAKKVAKQIKNSQGYLTSLKQLSDLNPKNSREYLNQYIQFNDSLVEAERKIQEKFTKIDFETDEYIEETKRLSEQTIIISITSVGLILILSLAYFLRSQKSKNEKLVLEAEQQKANEQVYLLTLEQQAIIEEERVQERNRISEELHDGVLGRLFGTRVGLGFLDLNASDETEQQHEAFLDELQEIEKEIRDVSHKLSNNFSADQINFSSLIQQLLKTNSATGNFKFEVSFDDLIAWKNISQLIKINIYRVVQESLQNIVKSAHAKNVILDFSIEKMKLIVCIKDDGDGFDMKKAKKGIGIKNMKSRIQKLKGTLVIESKMKQGTSILIEIPLEN